METCVSATWIKFCAQLLRLTADPSYADSIELCAYNALIAAQRADGKWWAHYSTMKGTRKPAPEQSGMHMNCCVASGPRALFLLPKIAYMTGGEMGLYVNLYENGSGKVYVPAVKGDVVLKVSDVDYGAENLRAKIKLEMQRGFTDSICAFAYRLGAKKLKYLQTARLPHIPTPGVYAVLKRDWKNGDEVEVEFDSRAFIVRDPSDQKRFAVRRGPFVYASDKRFDKAFGKPGLLPNWTANT